jgi:hypothetical protein
MLRDYFILRIYLNNGLSAQFLNPCLDLREKMVTPEATIVRVERVVGNSFVRV